MAKKEKKEKGKIIKKQVAKVEPTPPSVDSLIPCVYANDRILSPSTDAARLLYNQSRFGALVEEGRVHFSMLEALFLIEKQKIVVLNAKKKVISFSRLLELAKHEEKNVWVRYHVFKDLRSRGYIVKTALKFGADFRVYDRGVKPGDDHARWIVYPMHETSTLTWYEFSAKNRVAHSTKKRILMAIVDDEGDVTYWEVRWMRP